MEMKTLNYNCCFCDKPGEVSYDDSLESMPAFEKLLNILPKRIACKRCAKFNRRRNDLSRAIALMAVRWSSEPLHMQEQIRQRATDNLARALQKLCDTYEDYFHLTAIFDHQMTGLILEHPDKVGRILSKLDWTARHPQKITA